MSRRLFCKLPFALLALVLALNAGCALAIIGAAAGAGAAGYMYYNGLLTRDFHAPLAETRNAVRSALQELQFPLIQDKSDTGTASIKTRTADGYSVWIYLDVVPSPIPAERAVTRVAVRVGFSGDERVSRQILDQVASQLKPYSLSPTSPPKAGLLPPRTLSPKPDVTGPPPLATKHSGTTTKK